MLPSSATTAKDAEEVQVEVAFINLRHVSHASYSLDFYVYDAHILPAKATFSTDIDKRSDHERARSWGGSVHLPPVRH